MTHIVLKLQGKGQHSRADYVSVHQFATNEEAAQFVIDNTRPDEKYWTVASIIEARGEEYETTIEALL